MPKPNKLAELMAEHAELYREFLPTIKGYQDLATRVLKAQIEIFKHRLKEAFPKAHFRSRPLITAISARQTPAELGALLEALAKEGTEVAEIGYDPKNFTFALFGKEETE